MLNTLKGKKIKLIALDLDGTLFLPDGTISEKNQSVIKKAISKGIHVCLSSGRPFSGLPKDVALKLGMRYAITANGSGVYDMTDGSVIGDSPMSWDTAVKVLESVKGFNMTRDSYINGSARSAGDADSYMELLGKQKQLTDGLKSYLVRTRTFVGDLSKYIEENKLSVHKFTFNFCANEHGIYEGRDEVEKILRSRDDITVVSGGYGDLEVTAKDVDKANGIKILCKALNIDKENVMSMGDTENDLAMIVYSGVGVAMANSEDIILENADYITLPFDEDGVAYAIEQILD
ncbi:MAG: Cof-type HAD-IIB family hydrolase [Lachnospiraceae bacterium]|nr:Cof-type HAD-IIB family hydrolase [Lachnospiraceae bacterium]